MVSLTELYNIKESSFEKTKGKVGFGALGIDVEVTRQKPDTASPKPS